MAKKTKKAIKKKATKKKAASGLTQQRKRVAGSRARSVDGTSSAAAADSRALPHPQFTLENVETFHAAIESLTALADRGPDGLIGKMDRLLATTSEIRERCARLEVEQAAMLRRVALLEESQRPPEPAPDREAAVRKAVCRWTLANHCRALNLTRPTAAIVGRVMHDERVFDQRTAKSPHVLFDAILVAVRRVFRLAATQSGQDAGAAAQDYVHLTEEVVEVIEERSSIPKNKHSEFLKDELKPRLELLANSGLAREITIHTGRRVNYDRFLTPMGREIFDGWPEWEDTTGGISLADEQMPPDLNSAGRPVIGVSAPLASQPASPPLPQPPPPPPPSAPT